MNIDIEAKPSYGMAIVALNPGEDFVAESGAMVAMSTGLTVETRFNGTGGGGFFDWIQAAFTGLLRKLVAGETMFVNHYHAKTAGEVMLAPSMIGDVIKVEVDDIHPITVQTTSYMGSATGVKIDLIWAGFSMLFSKEGAFFMRCTGRGPLLVNAYGAIEEVPVHGSYRVDTGHVVAFKGDLEYTIRRVGGWKATLLSGEGLVLEFTGNGTLWLQTRNINATVSWLTPILPA
jgi:uncharacterized protein (TIGR00266 family)